MSDLRKAAEMALEALEWNYGTDLENIENCTAWLDKMNATIPALRQALAQPDEVLAEREAVLETIDELIGSERDRHPMFSDGYDYALQNIDEFVRAREKNT